MWRFAMNSPGKENWGSGLARGKGDSLWVNRFLTLVCFMAIGTLHILVLAGFDYFKMKEKPLMETRELSLTLDVADHTAEEWDEGTKEVTEAAPEVPPPAVSLPQEEVPLPEPASEEIPVLQEESSTASLSEPELPLPADVSLSEPERALPVAASFSASDEGASMHTGNVAPSEPSVSPLAGSVSGPKKKMTDAEYLALIMRRLEKNKIYPLSVRKRGIEGDITVSFTIKQDGTVSKISLADPSGHRFLAQAAFETIRSASPFPIMEGREGDYTAQVNIRYRLEDQPKQKD
jgi:protein TonB